MAAILVPSSRHPHSFGIVIPLTHFVGLRDLWVYDVSTLQGREKYVRGHSPTNMPWVRILHPTTDRTL